VEVWREEDVIAKIDISDQKSCVVGSHPTKTTIHSYHKSISRQHAALVFHGKKNNYYLIDLKSFHGTFINEERLTAYVPTFVPLGAAIRFGESTRKYVIVLDESGLERDEDVNFVPKKKQKVEKNYLFTSFGKTYRF